MIKRIFILFLVSVFIFNTGFLHASDGLSLEVLIQEAKENSPDLLAAKKRYEASLARIPLGQSLQDPTLSFNFEKMRGSPFQFNKAASEDRMISLSQFIPWFGKLSLKGKIATVEAQMFASEYKDQELEIINAIKNAYYDLFMNYKEVELDQESINLLENIAKVAEANYALGDISQEEVYKIHSELARLNIEIENLKQERAAKETRINTLLNRDPESPLGKPQVSEKILLGKDIKSLYQDTLLNRPELIIFAYAIERNKHAKNLAKKSFFPDLMAQITERGFTTGTIGPWDLMLAFTIPLWFWKKQRYEVKEAIANLEEAQVAYKAMQNKAFSDVKDLAVKIEVSQNKISLYKTTLIPILDSSIQSSLSAFRATKGDFMLLLDAQRMLIEAKINYYKALVEYNMNLADLERAVGIDSI